MKRTLLYILFIIWLGGIISCSGDDERNASIEGVWSYLYTESEQSCELVIGGSNAISSGGIYTRLAITNGNGDFDILVGGTVYTEAGENGVIKFSETKDGTTKSAWIARIE